MRRCLRRKKCLQFARSSVRICPRRRRLVRYWLCLCVLSVPRDSGQQSFSVQPDCSTVFQLLGVERNGHLCQNPKDTDYPLDQSYTVDCKNPFYLCNMLHHTLSLTTQCLGWSCCLLHCRIDAPKVFLTAERSNLCLLSLRRRCWPMSDLRAARVLRRE